ncbi:hypothetical protein D9756_009404 [Leucocoprinus leucothites]|uniref:Uncharacterized protein n=1 Tax=Leucocoprinus leucothites TaxID=201217 RepID=A0A8H5CWJ5_9AGAR|nr:hypothetical protein D9756_009404 [Leucoagaricus leucothites]
MFSSLRAREFDVSLSIPSTYPYNIAFLTLNILGAAAFVIVLSLTEMLHRYNIRHHAWRSFCVSWIVFGLSYAVGTCILMSYQGGKNSGRSAMAVCAIQSGLIYAAPVLVANTTLGLIIQLRSIMLVGMNKAQDQLSSRSRILVATIPWIIWTINFFGVLAYALIEPSKLEMNDIGTYCHLKIPTMNTAILVVLMYKRGFRLAGKCDASKTAIRLGIFMLQVTVGIGLALAIVFTESNTIVMDLIIAIQSPIAALIFGLRTLVAKSLSLQRQSILRLLGGVLT